MAWVAAWALLWGAATVAAGVMWFGQPLGFQLMAVLLVLVFALVNGISVGMVDQNPISSAFVLTVILMAAAGLRAPHVGLIAATVLLVATAEASDMQQDRSTGWRLGSDRMVQFGYQVAGIVVGALVQLGKPSLLTAVIAGCAVLVATINIAGGFLVTQRMLRMFRR